MRILHAEWATERESHKPLMSSFRALLERQSPVARFLASVKNHTESPLQRPMAKSCIVYSCQALDQVRTIRDFPKLGDRFRGPYNKAYIKVHWGLYRGPPSTGRYQSRWISAFGAGPENAATLDP